MTISKIDFIAWKSDPVTQFMFKYFEEVVKMTIQSMTNHDVLSDTNGLLILNRRRGYVDAIEEILHLEPPEEEENNEISKSTRI